MMVVRAWDLLRAYQRPLIASFLLWKLLLVVIFVLWIRKLETSSSTSWKDFLIAKVEPSALNRTPHNPSMLIYNRVPKSGSTTLKTLLTELGHEKGFIHRSSREFFYRQLTWQEEKLFVQDLMRERQMFNFPFSFDRHIYYVNFTSQEVARPAYINLLRDPASRAASLFYFSRMDGELRRSLRTTYGRSLHNDSGWSEDLFGECVLEGLPECRFQQDKPFETAVTYFCGSSPECLEFNNMDALQRAKMTLEMEYSVVGVLEKLEDSLRVMEAYVPSYLKGIRKIFRRQSSTRKQGNPSQHPPPSEQALNVLRQELKTEYELYQFAEQRLMKQLKAISETR